MNQRPSGYEPDELPGCSTPQSGVFGDGGAGGSRTHNPQIRSLMLYPVELQPQEPKTGHSILFFSAECKGVSPLIFLLITEPPVVGEAVVGFFRDDEVIDECDAHHFPRALEAPGEIDVALRGQ